MGKNFFSLCSFFFKDMRDEKEFTHVALAWEDCKLGEAHNVILAGSSPKINIHTHWSELDDLLLCDQKVFCVPL